MKERKRPHDHDHDQVRQKLQMWAKCRKVLFLEGQARLDKLCEIWVNHRSLRRRTAVSMDGSDIGKAIRRVNVSVGEFNSRPGSYQVLFMDARQMCESFKWTSSQFTKHGIHQNVENIIGTFWKELLEGWKHELANLDTRFEELKEQNEALDASKRKHAEEEQNDKSLDSLERKCAGKEQSDESPDSFEEMCAEEDLNDEYLDYFKRERGEEKQKDESLGSLEQECVKLHEKYEARLLKVESITTKCELRRERRQKLDEAYARAEANYETLKTKAGQGRRKLQVVKADMKREERVKEDVESARRRLRYKLEKLESELTKEKLALSEAETKFLIAKRKLLRARICLLEAKIAELSVPDEKVNLSEAAKMDCGWCYIIVRLLGIYLRTCSCLNRTVVNGVSQWPRVLLDDEDGTFVVDILKKAEKEYMNDQVDYLDENCLSFVATLFRAKAYEDRSKSRVEWEIEWNGDAASVSCGKYYSLIANYPIGNEQTIVYSPDFFDQRGGLFVDDELSVMCLDDRHADLVNSAKLASGAMDVRLAISAITKLVNVLIDTKNWFFDFDACCLNAKNQLRKTVICRTGKSLIGIRVLNHYNAFYNAIQLHCRNYDQSVVDPSENPYMSIIGSPGIGKTTMITYIILRWYLKQDLFNYENKRIDTIITTFNDHRVNEGRIYLRLLENGDLRVGWFKTDWSEDQYPDTWSWGFLVDVQPDGSCSAAQADPSIYDVWNTCLFLGDGLEEPWLRTPNLVLINSIGSGIIATNNKNAQRFVYAPPPSDFEYKLIFELIRDDKAVVSARNLYEQRRVSVRDAIGVKDEMNLAHIIGEITETVNSLDDAILREFLRGNDHALFTAISKDNVHGARRLLFQVHVPGYNQITESTETYHRAQSKWRNDLSSFYGFFRKREVIIPSPITSLEVAKRTRECSGVYGDVMQSLMNWIRGTGIAPAGGRWLWEEFVHDLIQEHGNEYQIQAVPLGTEKPDANTSVWPLLKLDLEVYDDINSLLRDLSTGQVGYFRPLSYQYPGVDGIYVHKEEGIWHCWMLQITKSKEHSFHLGQFVDEWRVMARECPKDVDLDVQFFLIVPEEDVSSLESYRINKITAVQLAFDIMRESNNPLSDKFGFPKASTNINIWESECAAYVRSMIKVAVLSRNEAVRA